MTKHNWEMDTPVEMICRRSGSLTWSKAMVDCEGCGAVVPTDRIYVFQEMTGEELRHEADILWHEELRPMAAFVEMVEEADG